ncbi:DUF5719 family protein [Dermabacteraceae bacterium P13077]
MIRTATRRLLLGTAALIPAAAVVALTLELPVADLASQQREKVSGGAGGINLVCPGPFTPRENLAQSTDASYQAVPPSPIAQLRGISLASESPLLYGATTANTTGGVVGDKAQPPALRVSNLAADPVQVPLTQGPLVDTLLAGESKESLLVSAPATAASAMLSSNRTDSGDMRGANTFNCDNTAVNHVFTGIDTLPGSSARLVLQNPSGRAVTVSLRLFGSEGALDAAGRGTVRIAPHGREDVLIESIHPDRDALALSVSAAGAPVSAYVELSRLEGITPGGSETLAGVSKAGNSLIAAGVLRVDGAPEPVVYLFNDTATPAKVELTAVGPAGKVSLGGPVEVSPNQVSLVPASSLPAGIWAVQAEANTPVRMSVTSSVQSGAPAGPGRGPAREIASVSPQEVLVGASLVPLVPDHAADSLVLHAQGGAAQARVISVRPDGSAGSDKQIAVPADGVAATDIAQLAEPDAVALVVLPGGEGRLRGSVLHRPNAPDGPMLSSYPLVSSATNSDTAPVTYTRP